MSSATGRDVVQVRVTDFLLEEVEVKEEDLQDLLLSLLQVLDAL